MKAISGKDFCRTLEKHGWILIRVTGSHHIYGKVGFVVRLSIPVHGNESLKRGLLNRLMKMAELAEDNL